MQEKLTSDFTREVTCIVHNQQCLWQQEILCRFLCFVLILFNMLPLLLLCSAGLAAARNNGVGKLPVMGYDVSSSLMSD